MTMFFPGIDPYLENPAFYPGLHNALIVYIADQLQPLLHPRYIAAVEVRAYIEAPIRNFSVHDQGLHRFDSTDLEIHESYVAILDRATGQRIVTVIEVVSPTNKHSGPGRDSYLSKQHEIRYSETHLVEIDLLRAGHSVVAAPPQRLRHLGKYDYLVSVERAGQRGRFEIYRRSVRDPLPAINIPLADDDPDVPLKLQDAIAQVYNAGSYRDRIDYSKPCFPPLSEEDQTWSSEGIAAAS